MFGGAKELVEFGEVAEQLSSDFRNRLGVVPEEEEDLTDAFKARLGLLKSDELSPASEIHEIVVMNDIEKDATLSRFKFEKFVEEYYKLKNFKFIKEPLKEPLLSHLSSDNNAGTSDETLLNHSAVVISHAIKHFCKDIQPNVNKRSHPEGSSANVSTLVYNNLEELKKPEHKEDKQNKRVSMMKLFQSKSSKNEEKKKVTTSLSSSLEAQLDSIPSNEYETAQFIVSYGLLKKSLRDEIFCQLCSQVTNNPSNESTAQGWVLHLLCIGCFMPSSTLLRFYISFLNSVSDAESQDFAKKTLMLLHRTNSFGQRFHPPNSLEFLAIKSRKKIKLPVLLADGSVVSVSADSATTASEICHEIYRATKLKDQFGFAIYISVSGKVSSLGNGLDHVMDAVAECEQVMKYEKDKHDNDDKKRQSSSSIGWQLSFGKELFTPWHDPEIDQKSSELIYRQICRSVANAEFKFKSEEDLTRFLVKRFIADFGPDIGRPDMKKKLKEYLPMTIVNHNDFMEDHWLDLCSSTIEKMDLKKKKVSQLQVKWSIVEGAQRKWPLQFSALFEVYKLSGPPLANDKLILAISCRGIFLLEEPFKLIYGLHYYEIIEVTCGKPSKDSGPNFRVTTIKGEEWSFGSSNSETITKLLCTFLDGLRRRSKWAVAIDEFVLRDHSKNSSDDFHLRHGDVIELLDESEQSQLSANWMYGKCERTGKPGPFPYDAIYIFPTNEKPPKAFLNLFSGMNKGDFSTLPRKRGAVVLGKSTLSKGQGFGSQSAI